MHKHIIFIMLCITLSFGYASDMDKKTNIFSLGIKSGIFVPHHSIIQGYSFIRYNSSESPIDLAAEGFGNGSDLRLFCAYTNNRSGLAVMIECGIIAMIGNRIDLALAPDGEHESYENRMIIIPLTFSSIYKIKLKEQKFILDTGFGFSLYLSDWETKHCYYLNHEFHRETAKGNSNPVGIHVISGFEYPIFHTLTMSLEFRYSFVQSNWKIKDQDSKEMMEYRNLNTGGCSLLIGIGYNF
jgi:hypothetical protein